MQQGSPSILEDGFEKLIDFVGYEFFLFFGPKLFIDQDKVGPMGQVQAEKF